MADFNTLFQKMIDLGIADTLLPFFLIFIVTFAIFEKTKVLGEHKKNMNIAIAFIVGMAVVIPHMIARGSSGDIVPVINNALPQVSAVMIAIVAVFLLIGLFAPSIGWNTGPMAGGIVVLAVAIVIYIFGNSANWWSTPSFLNWFTGETQALVLIILVFVALVLFITSPEGGNNGGGFLKGLEGIGNFFRGH